MKRIQSLVVGGEASQANEAARMQSMNFGHVGGKRLCLYSKAKIRRDGNTISASHGDYDASIVFKDGLWFEEEDKEEKINRKVFTMSSFMMSR